MAKGMKCRSARVAANRASSRANPQKCIIQAELRTAPARSRAWQEATGVPFQTSEHSAQRVALACAQQAGVDGSRTHPGRDLPPRTGFEDRGRHQATTTPAESYAECQYGSNRGEPNPNPQALMPCLLPGGTAPTARTCRPRSRRRRLASCHPVRVIRDHSADAWRASPPATGRNCRST